MGEPEEAGLDQRQLAIAKELGQRVADAEWECYLAIADEEQWIVEMSAMLDRRN